MVAWYYDDDGRITGPCSPDELRELANNGLITPETRIRSGDDGDWTLAGTFKSLFKNRPEPNQTLTYAEYKRIPLFGTESLQVHGRRIVQTLPVVRARRVEGISALKDLFVNLRDYFGGRSKTLEETFERMESEVMDDLRMKAATVNGNAIVRFRLQHGVIETGNGGVMLYIAGQGTPVIVESTPTAKTK